jgi:hypothetical protein
MERDEKTRRRLCIVITDEETDEHVATLTGVEMMVLLVAPDTLHGGEYRRIIIGDTDLAQSMLLDTLEDLLELSGDGAVIDLSELLQDLLEEAVESLPVH